jgi:hypothetical protein
VGLRRFLNAQVVVELLRAACRPPFAMEARPAAFVVWTLKTEYRNLGILKRKNCGYFVLDPFQPCF